MRLIAVPLLLLLSGCEVKIDSHPSATPPTSGKVIGKDYVPAKEVWVATSNGEREQVMTPELFIIVFEGADSLGQQRSVRIKVSGEVFGRLNYGDEFDTKR